MKIPSDVQQIFKQPTGMYSFNSVAFSYDGRWLASACNDLRVRIWNIETGVLQQMLKGPGGWVDTVAFSSDGRCVASAFNDTVVIWDVETGALRQNLEIGVYPKEISFGPCDSHLVTERGSIILDLSSSGTIRELEWSGYGLTSDKSWITCNGKNILWLPPEYRPFGSISAIKERRIAIRCKSGRVVFVKFSLDFVR
jgi:WD40 repeat protein